jgi:chromatin remodeling complex protein RSC6
LRKKGKPFLSTELAAVTGVEKANHFEVVKLLWVYIKEHDLQNPENKYFFFSYANLTKSKKLD